MQSEIRPPASGCHGRVMAYVRDHMRRDGDSEQEVQHKAVWVLFLAACSVASVSAAISLPSTGALTGALLAFLAWAWWRREVTKAYLNVVTAFFIVGICYYDALGAAVWNRFWPLFVIVIDVLLVIEAPRYLTKAVVTLVVVWLLLVEVEDSTRAMGLFDLPDSSSYDRRRADVCHCERPPCARHQGLGLYMTKLAPLYVVFLLDFFLTRGFADKVLAEKSKMAAAVQAAEDIARSLAGFDLETASACLLRAEQDLPAELHTSLQQLLANLGSYRPYLPQSMLADNMDSASDSASDVQSWEGPSEGLPAPPDSSKAQSSSMFLSPAPAEQARGSRTFSAALSSSRKSSRGSRQSPPATPMRKLPSSFAANAPVNKVIAVVQLTLHHTSELTSTDACKAFRTLHTSFLAAVLGAASANRGIVDTFTGTSVQVTFNASRPATGPAAKAVEMVNKLRRDGKGVFCSGGAVLEAATVGVLGTEALRRPTVLGEAPELGMRLAEYARAAGIDFVCNTGLYMETRLQHAMRVVMDIVMLGDGVRGDAARQVVVYELLAPAAGSAEPAEWMYELEAAGGSEWLDYNSAGRRQLLGLEKVGSEEAWERAEAAGRTGRRWDFALRVNNCSEDDVEIVAVEAQEEGASSPEQPSTLNIEE